MWTNPVTAARNNVTTAGVAASIMIFVPEIGQWVPMGTGSLLMDLVAGVANSAITGVIAGVGTQVFYQGTDGFHLDEAAIQASVGVGTAVILTVGSLVVTMMLGRSRGVAMV